MSDQMWSFLRLAIREGVKSGEAARRVCLLLAALSVGAAVVIIAMRLAAGDALTLIRDAVS